MISFIILNYKSLNDTLNCIDSIKKINSKKQRSIIVVDNNSTNLEEQKIIKKTGVDFIKLSDNVGFARGNNAGCEYAIKKYNPDFLCVLNSDIIINQKGFIDQIYKLYSKYEFDVLGPRILPDISESNNPFPAYKTLKEVDDNIKYTKKIIKIYENFMLRFLLKVYLNLKSFIRPKKQNCIVKEDVINQPLHGCALIFSKKYYEKYHDIFYNKTFLFHEEEFLYYRCVKDNLLFLYSPTIELVHLEGQSLNKEFNNNYKRIIFRNREILKSLEILKNVMEEERSI